MSEQRAVVFVVDDDPSMRRSLETLLRSVGQEVHLSAGITRELSWVATAATLLVRMPARFVTAGSVPRVRSARPQSQCGAWKTCAGSSVDGVPVSWRRCR